MDIKHTLCPPYHPASNGLAEKHVQTFKRMFIKYEGSQQLPQKMADILFRYRNLPHTTTGKTPAELFLGRTPRTVLSLVKPCLQRRVEQTQASTKFYRDGNHPKPRNFDIFQRVRVRNFRGGKEKWIPGTIVEVKGPLTYLVRVPGNNRRFVHADHLIPDDSEVSGVKDRERYSGVDIEIPESSPVPRPPVEPTIISSSPVACNEPAIFPETPVQVSSPAKVLEPTQITSPGASRVSRYGRTIRSPIKLNLYVH